MTKFVFAFTILALVAAFAGNPTAKVPVAHVTLNKPAIINGTALKAGDYRLTLGAGKVTFLIDKDSREIPAKIETGEKKFDVTEVQYDSVGNQATITEIRLGGTKTRILFN